MAARTIPGEQPPSCRDAKPILLIATTIKEAIDKWEEKTGDVAAESEKVMLCGMMPPIVRMDGCISKLVHVQHLALSSNNIERVVGLKALPNLRILSLSRNQIRKLDGASP
ncbi:hypothetical protein T484DRAFT_1817158 [Baffinella frigidus]|nr:hypothetical protein T484DRAFT_1817158 [Cryptophyta sp. CCMP2293]